MHSRFDKVVPGPPGIVTVVTARGQIVPDLRIRFESRVQYSVRTQLFCLEEVGSQIVAKAVIDRRNFVLYLSSTSKTELTELRCRL